MITIEKVSTGIVATPHNEDWQIEQLLPNLVFMGGDVRTIFNNPSGESYTIEFTIEWYLEDVRVRSFITDSDDAVISFDFNVNFEFDKMVIKSVGHDDVEICFKVITETGTDIKKIDFFNVEDESKALFWQYTRTSLYRGESLSLDGEQFVTQDGKIIPLEQDPRTKYNVVFGGVLGMPVWQAESLNAKFGNADFIKIDGGIFQVETPPALNFLSDNLVNVTVGGYFTTEQYRGAPLLPIIIPNDETPIIFDFLNRIKRINYGITLTPKV